MKTGAHVSTHMANPFELLQGGAPLSGAAREEIIAAYLTTSEKRAILARSTLRPGRELLGSPPTPELLKTIRHLFSTMERIKAHCTGGELFDHAEFDSIFKDLWSFLEDHRSKPPRKTAWEHLLREDL